jgi:hypothetical protein
MVLWVAGMVAFGSGVASASWMGGGSGSAYSKAAVMPTGAKPTTSVTGRNVTVMWTASTIGGAPVNGYNITRYNNGGALQTIGAGCTGTISALTCTENAVPAGTWKYAVTPLQSSWIGTTGVKSVAVVVAAASLTLTSAITVSSLPATLTGTLAAYVTGETVSFRLDDPVTGTLLAGSIAPDPIQTNGTANFSVTIPSGPANGAHRVYAVGSSGSQANGLFTVNLPDVLPPVVSTAAINKATGDTPSRLKQGGTYYVYTNVVDAQPSNGIASVTANVSTLTGGTTAAVMSAGAWTVGAVSYNYRSALLTADNPLSAGSKAFTITATDASANSVTQGGFSVTVDNTSPTATDIQTANLGGTAGKAEVGDTVTFTFAEAIDPNSILAAWTGATTNVTVRLTNGAGGTDDTLTVFNAANSAQLPLGSIDLGRSDYTAASMRFSTSTMAMSGSTITITLGTATGATTTAAATGTMIWTPSATATDQAGNGCSVSPATETGGADKDF